MEPFRMELWMKEVDEIIQTLELDNERYTRSTEVMGEEWLKDMVNRMVEPQAVTNNREAVGVGEEDINIDVYLEFKVMEWLKAELSNMRIDARTIARVEDDAKV